MTGPSPFGRASKRSQKPFVFHPCPDTFLRGFLYQKEPPFYYPLSTAFFGWHLESPNSVYIEAPIMQTRSLLALALAVVLASTPALAQHRSDTQIIADVRTALNGEAALQGDGNHITPSIHAGVVTLDGTVTSNAARILASKDLAEIDGIKTVLNNLTVVAPGAAAPSATVPPPTPHPLAMQDRTKLLELPARRQIPVRLSEELDTKTAKVGDTFHGTVAANVFQDGYPLIPVGTPVLGRVTEAKPAGRFVGVALLSIELIDLRLPVPSSDDQQVSVITAQLSSKTNGRGAGTAATIGGGAAGGGLIGALAGGGQGAAIGAAGGAALGTGARALMPGQQVVLKPETLLMFTTMAPISVPVLIHNGLPKLRPAATGDAEVKTRVAQSATPSREQ
jgi:hypothetical protein